MNFKIFEEIAANADQLFELAGYHKVSDGPWYDSQGKDLVQYKGGGRCFITIDLTNKTYECTHWFLNRNEDWEDEEFGPSNSELEAINKKMKEYDSALGSNVKINWK